MKPAPFAYVRAESLAHATALLDTHGDEAKPLAGGQSLGPLLNMRLSSPTLLIDINRIPDLTGPTVHADGTVVVGGLTRHRQLEIDVELGRRVPLAIEAAPYIGHRAIRNRGTLAGSLAHADPAAELPAVVVALDASVTASSVEGERTISAREFFGGYYTTSLRPTELLTRVSFPPAPPRRGCSWLEFAPRLGDYGYVGVAAVVDLDDRNNAMSVEVVFSGVSAVPHRSTITLDLVGSALDTSDLADVASRSSLEIEATGDEAASSGYKRRLMRHLGARALTVARDRARQS